MIKAILFDFNGVIIDDEPIQMRAYQQVLKDEGIDLTEADYLASLGMDDRRFVEAAGRRYDIDLSKKVDAILLAKTAAWREAVEARLPLFYGIELFIEKMARDFTLGIVSMARLEEIEFVLERADLARYFSAIVSAADVRNCKPDPECYRIGFQKIDAARTLAGGLPITRSECLAIEDSPPGVVAARAAGLQVLGVPNTVSEDELRAAGARATAKELRDWMPETFLRVFSNVIEAKSRTLTFCDE